jgi:DNA-binding transcriptional LysR family regulator
MELRDIDLNLLLVFSELLKEHGVSKVARNLGMSQPGVSNALNRLRGLLGDDLFLRTGRGMEPTPYAERLARPLDEALMMIHGTLNMEMSFEPSASTRNFTIAMTDIGEIDFLPNLMGAIERSAAGVTLSTVRKTAANLKDDLEMGLVDLAVGLLPDLKAGVYQRRLTASQYVCVFRRGHALDKGSITVDEFCAASHLVVISTGTGHGAVDSALERAGIARNVRLKIPHFAAIGHILRDTNLIATVPQRLVNRCIQPFNLAWAPAPVELDPIPINLFWAARYHRDPANQWLRGLMFDTFHDGEASRTDSQDLDAEP